MQDTAVFSITHLNKSLLYHRFLKDFLPEQSLCVGEMQIIEEAGSFKTDIKKQVCIPITYQLGHCPRFAGASSVLGLNTQLQLCTSSRVGVHGND